MERSRQAQVAQRKKAAEVLSRRRRHSSEGQRVEIWVSVDGGGSSQENIDDDNDDSDDISSLPIVEVIQINLESNVETFVSFRSCY